MHARCQPLALQGQRMHEPQLARSQLVSSKSPRKNQMVCSAGKLSAALYFYPSCCVKGRYACSCHAMPQVMLPTVSPHCRQRYCMQASAHFRSLLGPLALALVSPPSATSASLPACRQPPQCCEILQLEDLLQPHHYSGQSCIFRLLSCRMRQRCHGSM